MEKVSVDTEKRGSSRWIKVLMFMTLIQTIAFASVTIITFLDILELDQKDINLRYGIQELEIKLKGSVSDLSETPKKEKAEEAFDRVKRHVKSRLATRQSSLFVDMLKIQEAIFEKHCQNGNKTCPKGPKGEKGPMGQAGLDGSIGSFGFDGKRGPRGPKGQPGLKGPVGTKGLKGETGNKGNVGPVGLVGTKGENGLTGLRGENGPDGSKGVPGLSGDIGEMGSIGSPGLNKTQGQQGERGDPGIKGASGDPGKQGPKGNDSRKFADDCDCFKKPSFIPPNDATVTVGFHSSKDLPCNATGNPTPTVTVQKVPAAKRNVVSDGTKVMVSNASNADYSRFVCEARNQFGVVMKYIDIKSPTGK